MYDNVYNNKYGLEIPPEHIPSDGDLKRYAEGDSTIINELIEGLTRYVVEQVEWFVQFTDTAKPFEEDCTSEGLLALTLFVNNNLGKKFFSPTHFLNTVRKSVLNAVKDWLRTYSIAVTIPTTTQRDNDIQFSQVKLLENTLVTEEEVFDQVWYDIFIESLDTFDRKLVELALSGVSIRAIGREMELEHNTVQRHLQRLVSLYRGE